MCVKLLKIVKDLVRTFDWVHVDVGLDEADVLNNIQRSEAAMLPSLHQDKECRSCQAERRLEESYVRQHSAAVQVLLGSGLL